MAAGLRAAGLAAGRRSRRALLAQDGSPARDGRLGFAAGASGVGERVLLQGRVLDTAGRPVPGAVVELWQADVNGNYRHPRDASPDELLPDFQYFGTSTAGRDGAWAFLTVKPSPYGARPAHLHLQVKVEGRAVLTSQLYFEEDLPDVEADPVYGRAGRALLLQGDAGPGRAGQRRARGARRPGARPERAGSRYPGPHPAADRGALLPARGLLRLGQRPDPRGDGPAAGEAGALTVPRYSARADSCSAQVIR